MKKIGGRGDGREGGRKEGKGWSISGKKGLLVMLVLILMSSHQSINLFHHIHTKSRH
jgi:hypothetical protein